MPELTSEDVTSKLYDRFVQAGTFQSCMGTFRQICEHLSLDPQKQRNFYQQFKSKVGTWQAKSLWAKLDKRLNRKEYKKGKACANTRVLVIGAGPVGLRTAIECAMLGTKCMVVEKRASFSRNNVLHLWPFLITDLKNLGAKKFFGKFCAGAIDHISIRQLQLILLKVSLLMGVEIHTNVTFEGLEEPPEDQDQERVGWRAKLTPLDHPLSEFEFDVIVGADGKRNTLQGFKRKEFRGKLAIAITANFINRHTTEEARVEEISGVAFIFNQKFFQDLKAVTGIDLENIVYYRDDTHYFVMTAKKRSLLDKGVILEDKADTARLLARDNHNHEKLKAYAREAADFSTNEQLPRLDFALNHYGQPDVAMFDFTSLFQAEHASRIIERNGHLLLMALVGDSLLEPFWPTGSGCARGFLSAFDAAWMIRNLSSNQMSLPEVIAERESIYRLLAQTTPENLSKLYEQYGLTPSSRYPHVNLKAAAPHEVVHLYDTDDADVKAKWEKIVQIERQSLKRTGSVVRGSKLLMWCQRVTDTYNNVHISDMTTSWRNGLALCAIIHRYRPHLIDFNSLREEDIVQNNQLAFDLAEREFGISPTMTGKEIAELVAPDKLTMVAYVSRFYDLFKDELPPPLKSNITKIEEVPLHNMKSPPVTKTSLLSRFSNKFRHKKPQHGNKEDEKALSPVLPKRAKFKDSPEAALEKIRTADLQARIKERLMEQAKEREAQRTYDMNEFPTGTNRVSGLAEMLTAQFRTIAGLTVTDDNRPINKPKLKAFEPRKTQNSDTCFFCGKRVYVMERQSVEGLFFHRECFRCQHCETTLHVGNYVFDRGTEGKGKFFCRIHYQAGLVKEKQTPNRKRQHIEQPPPPPAKLPSVTTIPEDDAIPAAVQSPKDHLSEPIQKRYRATPERIELENMRVAIAANEVEVTEEEIAKYNLGTSLQTSGEEDEDDSSETDTETRSERAPSSKTLEEDGDEDATEDEDESDSDISEYSSDFDTDEEDEDSDEDSDEESDEGSNEESDEEVPVQKEEPRYNHISTVVSLKQQWLNDMKAPAMKPWRPPEEIEAEKRREAEKKRAEEEAEAVRKAEEARKVEEARKAEERLHEKEHQEMDEERKLNKAEAENGLENPETPEQVWPPKLQKSASKLKMNLEALSQQYAEFEQEAKTPAVPKESSVGLTDDQKVASLRGTQPTSDNDEDEEKDDWLMSGEEFGSEDSEDMSCDEVFDLDVSQPAFVRSKSGNKVSFDEDGEIITSPVPQGATSKPKTHPDRTLEKAHIPQAADSRGDGQILDQEALHPRTSSAISNSSFTISTPSGSFSSVSAFSASTDSLCRDRPEGLINLTDFVDSPTPKAVVEDMELDLTVQSGEPDELQTPKSKDNIFDLSVESAEVSPKTVSVDMDDDEVGAILGSEDVHVDQINPPEESVDLDLSVTSGYPGDYQTPKTPVELDLNLTDIDFNIDAGIQAEVSTKNGRIDPERLPSVDTEEMLKPTYTSTPDAQTTAGLMANGSAIKSPDSAAKQKPKYRPMYNKRDSGPRLVMSRSFSDSFKEIPSLDVVMNVANEKDIPNLNANSGNGVVYRDKKRVLPTRPDSPCAYVAPPAALRPTSIRMDTLTNKRDRTYSGGTARDKVDKKKEVGTPKKSPKRQLPKVPSKDNDQIGELTPEDKEIAKRMLIEKAKRRGQKGRSSSGSSTSEVLSPHTISVQIHGDEQLNNSTVQQTPVVSKTSSSSDQYFTPETDNAPTSEYLSFSPGEKSPLSDYTPSQFTDGIPQSESRSEEKKSRLSRLRGDGRRRGAIRKSENPKYSERKSTGKKSRKKKSHKSKSMSSLSELEDRSAAYRVADSTDASLASRDELSAEGDLDTTDTLAEASGGVAAGGNTPTSSKLPRLIRKLTVDPSLTASLDLDSLSSSSEAEEQPQDVSLKEAASPETKGKGKAKSPKRMWGKRFKVFAKKPPKVHVDQVMTKKSPKADEDRRKVEEEELNDKLTRRVQREARRQHHQQQLKRHRMAQEIQRQLQEVEVKQRELENRGVSVEKALRGEGTSDGMDESTLMQHWFNLVNEKNALVRYESELMVQSRELELEDRHCQLEQELRQRMAVEDHNKTEEDRRVEKLLLEEMLEVVEQRDALVALLEDERLKEQKEDMDIEEVMLKKGLLTARSDVPIHV